MQAGANDRSSRADPKIYSFALFTILPNVFNLLLNQRTTIVTSLGCPPLPSLGALAISSEFGFVPRRLPPHLLAWRPASSTSAFLLSLFVLSPTS